jgi:hypothetical protein
VAAVLDAPAARELTYVSFPIEKFERDADGDLIVYGKATDGAVDSDDQIVSPEWASKAFADWHESGGNVRMSHDPRRPVGKSLVVDDRADGCYVRTLVVDKEAQRLVEKGVLRAYSVGIARPMIQRDMTGKARGGIISGGDLAELSLVDRPANRNCVFTVVKADGSGNWAYVGELDGAGSALASITTPADLAKAAQARRDRGELPRSYADPVAQRLADALAADQPLPPGSTLLAKRVTASGQVTDSAGQDRSDVPAGDFAGPGKTFPIDSQGDVSDAASLAHHAKNPAKVRSRIRAIAHRKFPGMTLPPSLDGAAADKGDGPDDGIDAGSVQAALDAGALPAALAVKMLGYAGDGAYQPPALKDAPPGDGKPFGGKKAMPFGKKPKKAKPASDGDSDDMASKATGIRAQIALLEAELAKYVPTACGDTGLTSQPVPAHRGGGSMELGPDVIHPDQPWGKVAGPDRVTDAPYAACRAHDATCPAYHPDLVRAAYPALTHPGLACDPQELRDDALKAVASGDLEAGERLLGVAKAASYLAAAEPLAVTDAMTGLHKAFTDMYPSVRLTPGKVMPQQFRRGPLTAGQERTPPATGPYSAHDITTYQPDAADFRRGPLTAGQAAASPGNKGDSNPLPAGSPAGAVYAHAVAAQQASAALRTIHDAYAARWNGVCPLPPSAGPATPGGLAKAKKKKAKKPPEMMAPMDPVPAMPKAAGAADVTTGTDITVLLAQVERRLRKIGRRRDEAELVTKSYEDRISGQATEIAELRRSVHELGSQAATDGAPPRSVVKAASGVEPAERRSLVDEAGEQQRAEQVTWARQMAASGDPVTRENGMTQLRRLHASLP